MRLLRSATASLLLAWCFSLPAQTPPEVQRGLLLTFTPENAARKQREGVVTQRARLLALCVERDETPTPTLSPGPFSARFAGTLQVPDGEQFLFRLVGKGHATVQIDGATLLSGALRLDRPLDSAQVELLSGPHAVVATVASTPQGEATLRLSWSGPGFEFEPVPPELWQCEVDEVLRQGELLRLGQQLLVEHRCARCHRPSRPAMDSAFVELDNCASDLRNTGARLQAGWVAQWLADPQALRPKAAMPKLPLSATEVADIASHLDSLGRPQPAPEFTAEQRSEGERLYLALGCIACHRRAGDQAADDLLPLERLAARWQTTALVDHLKSPRGSAPTSHMPDFRLSPAEAKALAACLLDASAAPTAGRGNSSRGKRLIARAGCARCHLVDIDDSSSFRELANLNVKRGCLDPGRKSPDFHLDAEETAALRAFLPLANQAVFRKAPIDFAARAIAARGCVRCHPRDGAPSAWSRVLAERPTPPGQPAVDAVPALTWAGEKLLPTWFTRFLAFAENPPRPWLQARMPAFGGDGVVIATGMLREHGFGSLDDAMVARDDELVAAGRQLVQPDRLGCVQCHKVGDQPAVSGEAHRGIDLAVAAERLRGDYFARWLQAPARVDAGIGMPQFAPADGKTACADLLGGDPARQFEAIWQCLQSLQ